MRVRSILASRAVTASQKAAHPVLLTAHYLNISAANAALVTKRIRQVGVKRILYGSDAAAGGNLHPRESWAAFRRLHLTEAEFNQIAKNVAPYLR